MLDNNNKTVLVEMSGGVDSSIAFILLKEQGYNVIGVSFKYPIWESKKNLLRENACCTLESFKIAEYICKRYGSEYHIIDQQNEFKDAIMGYFNNELKNGNTPNPCIICNKKLKFGLAFNLLEKFNADYISTGHYVKVMFNEETKEYDLYQPLDLTKDQTYFLHVLNQEKLSKVIFPLSDIKKEDVYKIATAKALKIYQDIKESSDFCFVAGKSKDDYLKDVIGNKKGDIVNTSGKKIGEHNGLHYYTIGQRKGLGFFNTKPHYVCDMDFKNNKLIICSEEEKDRLFKKELIIDNVNIINPSFDQLLKNGDKIVILAKNRYQQKLQEAEISFIENNKYKIIYKEPQLAITKGQFCVFYENKNIDQKKCLGGGEIIDIL